MPYWSRASVADAGPTQIRHLVLPGQCRWRDQCGRWAPEWGMAVPKLASRLLVGAEPRSRGHGSAGGCQGGHTPGGVLRNENHPLPTSLPLAPALIHAGSGGPPGFWSTVNYRPLSAAYIAVPARPAEDVRGLRRPSSRPTAGIRGCPGFFMTGISIGLSGADWFLAARAFFPGSERNAPTKRWQRFLRLSVVMTTRNWTLTWCWVKVSSTSETLANNKPNDAVTCICLYQTRNDDQCCFNVRLAPQTLVQQ